MTSIAARPDAARPDTTAALRSIATSQPPKQLIFIDTAVEDFLFLVRGVHPHIAIGLLYPYQDGIQQMTRILAHRSGIAAIHIVSQGEPGKLRLGNAALTIDSIPTYADALWQWRQSLAPQAEILIYGCRVAIDPQPPEFSSFALLNRIHALTGAQVAASSQPTGNAALGGNWELNVQTGDIHTPLAFPPQVREAYTGILA